MTDWCCKSRVAVAAVVVPALLGLCSAGCFSEADLGSAQALCPPGPEEFRPVNNVLERRCGTLDCHGHPGRPFIVYGQTSYRRPDPVVAVDESFTPEQYFPGGLQATLEYEVAGTYESACGLEPEEMDAVVKGESDISVLTLVRKPRLREKHKGGRIWGAGTTAGDRCLVSWVLGELEVEACTKELQLP